MTHEERVDDLQGFLTDANGCTAQALEELRHQEKQQGEVSSDDLEEVERQVEDAIESLQYARARIELGFSE